MEDPSKSRESPNEMIVRIIIHYCEKLKSEVLLTRPILCLHVIDGNHGTYVKKSDRNRAVMSFYENQRADMDYIMPIMTQPSTIQGQKFHISWEEAFILNEKFDHFVKKESNTILFFEIIDLMPLSGTKQQYERLNQNGMRKIAWAFLKMLGSNEVVNVGSKLRLQLYKPCSHSKKKELSRIEVYHWWSKLSRIPLSASLYVTVEPYVITFNAEPTLRSMLPMQEEIGSSNTESLSGKIQQSAACISKSSKSSADNTEIEVTWQRKKGEPCEVPSKLSVTLETTNKCHLIKFSSSGRMLAAGCGGQEHYYILIYGIPNGKLLKKELAHSDLIYDLDWSQNDTYLLSASGDYSVKLWSAKSWIAKASFIHPSFVYSAKFQPLCENILATACYDHVVRIWTFNKVSQLLKELEAHTSSVCCVSWHENGRKLYSSDSSGHIKVWKIPSRENINNRDSYDICNLEKEIDLKETKGVSINKIIPEFSRNTICLFCSDSVVRRLDLFSGNVLTCYKSHVSRNVLKGCCSPCGNLLFLCCDDGHISVWDKSKCEVIASIVENLPSKNLSCLEYHPYDHMLAVSSFDDGMPVHIYVSEESDRSDMKCKATTKKECKENNTASDSSNYAVGEITKESSSGEALNSIQNHNKIVRKDNKSKPYKSSKKYMYETEETIERSSETSSSLASKFDESSMKLGSSHKVSKESGRKKTERESRTAVITKSGQFDAIAADNFSQLNTEAERNKTSESDPPSALQRSSKRSQRRKRLREMYKQ